MPNTHHAIKHNNNRNFDEHHARVEDSTSATSGGRGGDGVRVIPPRQVLYTMEVYNTAIDIKYIYLTTRYKSVSITRLGIVRGAERQNRLRYGRTEKREKYHLYIYIYEMNDRRKK